MQKMSLIYYIYYIILISCCSYITVKVFKFFYYDKTKNQLDPILIEKYNLIKWIPIYLMISCIPAIFTRLIQSFSLNDNKIKWLLIIQILLEQSIGVFLLIIIVFSPPFKFIFKELMKKLLPCIFKDELSETNKSYFLNSKSISGIIRNGDDVSKNYTINKINSELIFNNTLNTDLNNNDTLFHGRLQEKDIYGKEERQNEFREYKEQKKTNNKKFHSNTSSLSEKLLSIKNEDEIFNEELVNRNKIINYPSSPSSKK